MPHLGALIKHHLIHHQVANLLYLGQPWPLLEDTVSDFSNLNISHCDIGDLSKKNPTQRSDLVIVRSNSAATKKETLKALGLAKNLLSEKIWLYDEQEIFEFSDLIALGFKRDIEAGENAQNVFSYNLQNYNKKRAWNNPKNWANPHRWHIRF